MGAVTLLESPSNIGPNRDITPVLHYEQRTPFMLGGPVEETGLPSRCSTKTKNTHSIHK